MLDDPNAEYEISASILAAIKCQDDRVGERGARADWAWDTWQTEWTFRQDNEVWRESMPWRIFSSHSDHSRLQSVLCRRCRHYSRTRESTRRTRL
jgi:hypothetical protein